MTRLPSARPCAPLVAGFLVLAPIATVAAGAGSVAGPAARTSDTREEAPAPSEVSATDVGERLDAALEASEAASIDDIWRDTVRLLAGLDANGRKALDVAVDARLRGGESDKRLLLLIGLRRGSADAPTELLASELSRLLRSEDDEIARGAAELLDDDAFDRDRITPELRLAILKTLDAQMKNIDRAPRTRLACAVALRNLGGGAERRAARHEMLSFLESADVRLRTLGALALARAGDEESGIDELERIAATPGPEGRLAAAYLEVEAVRRDYQRKIKDISQRDEERKEDDDRGLSTELERAERVMQFIQSTHLIGDQRSRAELLNKALDGMLRSLDEYSSFLSSDEYARYLERGRLGPGTSVGCQVQLDPTDGLPTITRVVFGGPAWRAGLWQGDKIVRIDDWPAVHRPLGELLHRLDGPGGSRALLYIWRRGMDYEQIDRPEPEMAHEVERRNIVEAPVVSSMLPGEVALIEVTHLGSDASRAVSDTVGELAAAGMTALVLDLRDTTGGLVEEAREVADVFLPSGKLVATTQGRISETRRYQTELQAELPSDLPMVVLVNRFTDGAAEILAAALQDHGRAEVVGERTWGDGAIQDALQLPGEVDDVFVDRNDNGRWDPGEELKRDFNENGRFDYAPRALLTVSRVMRPSGRSLRAELDENDELVNDGGVEPDKPAHVHRWRPWQLEEVDRLRREGHLRAWAAQGIASSPDLFAALATSDGDDPRRYPGFDELYTELNTALSPEDVHRVLRSEVRRLVQDARGTPFPRADFQNDLQLQTAIADVLERTDRTVAGIDAYAATFDLDKETRSAAALVESVLDSLGRDALASAKRAIEESLSTERALTPEELERIERILTSAIK